MPWGVKNVIDLRLDFIERFQSGERIAGLCREFGISRPTGYLWLKRYESSQRATSLLDRSHRPESCPHKTSAKTESQVVKLREKYGWGADKLQHLMFKNHGVKVPRVTINRIISRNGLIAAEDRHRPALLRFEREKPNELWQVDFKGPMGKGDALCMPLSVLDDHSRFSVGLCAVRSTQLEPIKAAFQYVFKRYGLPDSMLMDHGVPWWGPSNFLGLTRLSVWLMNQDIKLKFSGYNHPQTQGKVEAFHRTLQRAVNHKGLPRAYSNWSPFLKSFRREYNLVRPHEALSMNVPASRYAPSKIPFKSKIEIPEYPSGHLIQKVNDAGLVKFQGKNIFTSEALAGQYVMLYELEHSIIVYYRKTAIREVDVLTGKGSRFSLAYD